MQKYRIRIGENEHAVTLISRTESALKFAVGGMEYHIAVNREPEESESGSAGGRKRAPTGAGRGDPGEIRAPMPGVVVEICCKVGDHIEAGAPVVVIEAMKMENCITAGRGGVVREILSAAGKQVAGGELLVVIGSEAS